MRCYRSDDVSMARAPSLRGLVVSTPFVSLGMVDEAWAYTIADHLDGVPYKLSLAFFAFICGQVPFSGSSTL